MSQLDAPIKGAVGVQSDKRTSACVYQLYGIQLRSPWSLPCPEGLASSVVQVELFEGSISQFSEAHQAITKSNATAWLRHAQLRDGSFYVQWVGLFEFLISPDGRRIDCRPLANTTLEAFRTYLVGQVLSFALVKIGIEPLHATVVVIDGSAVAFLGDSGYGKSTLAAAFLSSGYPLLTDDLLVIKKEGGKLSACPGLPRIKLFPEIATHFFGERVSGTPMNRDTAKLIIPLGPASSSRILAPLRAMYVLQSPSIRSQKKRAMIKYLNQRQTLVRLISATFNTIVRAPDRLTRHFAHAAELAVSTPVKYLSYPRELSQLPKVVDAVRSDCFNAVKRSTESESPVV